MQEVQFDRVNFCRGERDLVLRNVSFSVAAGSFTSILGPSGCGKSTILRLIAGLERPKSGSVSVRGRNVADHAIANSEVGLVFTDYALFPHLSVYDNITFGLRGPDANEARIQYRANEMLLLLNLEHLRTRFPGALSGGEQQRVALARALVMDLPILLLDEPLANLDARLRRQLRDEIRGLQRRLGKTVIYVTHDFVEAMAVSDRIVLINEGEVAQVGTPRELYETPASTFVASFVGDMALFEVTVNEEGFAYLGPLSVAVRNPMAAGRAQLLIRPEAWRIEPAKRGAINGKVLRNAYRGHVIEYYLQTDLGEIFATSIHVRALIQPGTPVSISLRDVGHHLINLDQYDHVPEPTTL